MRSDEADELLQTVTDNLSREILRQYGDRSHAPPNVKKMAVIAISTVFDWMEKFQEKKLH